MPALPAAPWLDGEHLNGADTDSWEISNPQIKRVRTSATGKRREAFAYNGGGGKSLIRTSMVATLDWSSLGDLSPTVEELMALPGPHQLVLWRPEVLTFFGTGSRVEFEMPWQLAVDVVDTMPNGMLAARFEPRVKVGRAGTVLTYLSKSSVDYAAGTPGAGEVWFLADGKTFKLETAPTAGAYVFASVVPVFECFESGENPKKFSDPVREPRRLVLMEQ